MKFRNRVIALVLGLFCTLMANADEAEDQAVAAIKKLKGGVNRDETKPDKSVRAVSFIFNKNLTDEDLKLLRPLKGLESLDLRSTRITDEGLKNMFPFTD